MKRKQITSKLNFKKTTIVSFQDMEQILGGGIVNTDTVPVSQQGVSCLTSANCNTYQGQATCVTCGDTCNDSTTTRATLTDIGCVSVASKQKCMATDDC